MCYTNRLPSPRRIRLFPAGGLEASYSDLLAANLAASALRGESLQRPSCLPRVIGLIMSPIIYSRPSRHSRNQPVSYTRRKMASPFNIIRTSIYGACLFISWIFLLYSKRPTGSVILFTVICLAMAGHFQSVLAASDLSGHACIPFETLL